MKAIVLLLSGFTALTLCAGASFDADGTVSTNLVLDGEYEIYVTNNVTVTFSGMISGTGPIKKTGAGTLVLANADNPFSGGFHILQGYIRVDAAGAIGSGEVHFDGSLKSTEDKKYGVVRQLNFNVADATFANAFRFTGLESVSNTPMILATKSVTLSGAVVNDTAMVGNCYNTFQSGTNTGASAVLRFTGAVSGACTYQRLQTYGNIAFEGPFLMPNATLSTGGGRYFTGTLSFAHADTSYKYITANGNTLRCDAENVLGPAVYYVGSNLKDANKSRLELNGFSQKLISLGFKLANTEDVVLVKSDSPATLTLIGTDAYAAGTLNVTAYQRLCGALSLAVDAVNYPTFTQTFSYAAHTMTGTLSVSNGTVIANNSATFKSVPELHIGSGGALQMAGSTSAFAGVTNLVVDGQLTFDSTALTPLPTDHTTDVRLGGSAELTLPAGMTLRVKTLTIDGVNFDNGMYACGGAITQLKGAGSILVDNGEEEVIDAVWTGAGGDTHVSTVANWNDTGVPSALMSGKVRATFASGGTNALVDGTVKMQKLIFNATNDFAINAFSPSATLTLGSEGVQVSPAEGESARAYTLGVPTALPLSQSWEVGTNAALAVTQGVTTEPGIALTVAGDGTLDLGGTNTFATTSMISNRTIRISGMLATPGHIDQGVVGAWAGSTYIFNPDLLYIHSTVAGNSVTLDNAFIEKPILFRGPPGAYDSNLEWFNLAPGTTNVFTGGVYFQNPAGYLNTPAGTAMLFKRGVVFAATTYISGSYLCVTGDVLNARTGSGLYNSYTKIDLQYPGSSPKLRMQGGEIDCQVDNALTNTVIFFIGGYPRIRLHKHSAHFQYMESAVAGTYLEGENPATVYVGAGLDEYTNSIYRGSIDGAVTFVKTGDGGTLTLHNRDFTSSGDLIAEGGGTLCLTNATWRYGTNITVRGNATLKLCGDKLFNGKFAHLHIADAGVLDLQDGTCQIFKAMTVNGMPVKSGTYGSAASPAEDKEYAAHFTGSGTVRVLKCGFALILK